MFKQIVWATDGSEHSDRALAFAVSMARESGGTVHAAHVVQRLVGGKATGQYVAIDEEALDAKIEGQAMASEPAVRTELHMLAGTGTDVARPIAKLADDLHADVIVVGTRGHGALAGVALGSVTQRLLHAARCPVLAVPPAALAPERSDVPAEPNLSEAI
jgi:nucleotide-binding universal stress UspA family protein